MELGLQKTALWVVNGHVIYVHVQMLVMGKGMAPVVPPELQQYMHYITMDPAVQLMQMPLSEPQGPFQITHANPPQQESDFLSQMQNHLHPSDQPQINFLRPPKLQLYTPEQRGGLGSSSGHNGGWIPERNSSYNFME